MKEKFIVAEITKNWTIESGVTNLISQQLERVINTNDARGYKLIHWLITSAAINGVLTETIIAIFELKEFAITVASFPEDRNTKNMDTV
jgi:hypothetical protein